MLSTGARVTRDEIRDRSRPAWQTDDEERDASGEARDLRRFYETAKANEQETAAAHRRSQAISAVPARLIGREVAVNAEPDEQKP